MNSIASKVALRKCALLLLLVPVAAMAQKKTAPSAPKAAPAPHPSAPASAPHTAPSQGSNSARPSGQGGGASHGGTTNTGRTGTTGGGANSGRTSGTGSASTGAGAGYRGTANGHTTTGAAAGNRGTANGHTTTGAAAGNRGAANGHTTTGAAAGNRGATNGHATTGAAGSTRASASRTPPGKTVALRGGGSASLRPNGQIRSVNRNGMQIRTGLHGGRTVVSTRNGARIVSTGRRGGYVQRAYVTRGGRAYYSRTYYYHGAYRSGVYRGYYYGGRPYYGYYPPYYYRPAYYGWAYNPWPEPAPYNWGWAGQPWYGYYGPYYQPYPVYPSAAFWLTDYLVAASLRAAFEASQESGALLNPLTPDPWLVASMGPIPMPADAAVALTPAVKDMVADEVKAQLAEDQADSSKSGSSSGAQSGGQAASNDPPPVLDAKRRVFVVADDLTITADGEECTLGAGDIIRRVSDTPDDDQNLDVEVLASKKGDCAVGKKGSVALDDLQEMHNHFHEQLTNGMGELSKKQGTGGLPKAPDTTTVPGDVPTPAPDTSAAKSLEDQQTAADQTENEVKQEAASAGTGQ